MTTKRPTPVLLISIFCIALAATAALGGSPGCPPSFCPAADAVDPTRISRLTLFPGTASAVSDDGPGDLENSICGVIRVSDVPFPGTPWSSGAATFSGTIYMIPPDPSAAVPGQLVVTNAVIRSDSGAAGTNEEFLVQNPLPLACGEFMNMQGTVPAAFSVHISGTLETDGGDADVLVGGEEFNIEGRALKFNTTSPVVSPPPGRNFVEVQGPAPGSSTPGPYPLATSGTIYGTYEPGLGVIGLIMGGVLPSGESIHLPTSIEATFGQITPPVVPAGTGGTTPLTVAKVDSGGTVLSLRWDASDCNGSNAATTLIYGEGMGISMGPGEAFEPLGAVCDVGMTPPFTWDGVPEPQEDSPLLWWLLMRRDEQTGTEGSWGLDSMGNERDGSGQNGSSGMCQSTDKQVTHSCLP